MTLQLVGGWQECHDTLFHLLSGNEPVFVGRIGGSDTDAIAARLDVGPSDSEAGKRAALAHMPRVKAFNGYYDFSTDNDECESNFIRFTDLLFESYCKVSTTAFVGEKLLSMYFPGNLNESFILKDIESRQGFEALISAVSDANGSFSAIP